MYTCMKFVMLIALQEQEVIDLRKLIAEAMHNIYIGGGKHDHRAIITSCDLLLKG